MPTSLQRRRSADAVTPDHWEMQKAALREIIVARDKVFGDRGEFDIDSVPDPDKDEDMADVKDLVSRLGQIETKVRRVESAAGEVRFHAPKGSIIGAGGKVIQPKMPRPRDSDGLPVAKNKVKKITVEHTNGAQVHVLQHTAQGTFMTLHPNMASADNHIDAILEKHDHLESIHHDIGGGRVVEVGHNGDMHHGGKKVGKVKRDEKVSDALNRVTMGTAGGGTSSPKSQTARKAPAKKSPGKRGQLSPGDKVQWIAKNGQFVDGNVVGEDTGGHYIVRSRQGGPKKRIHRDDLHVSGGPMRRPLGKA